MKNKTCIKCGSSKKYHAKNLCLNCYMRKRRANSPTLRQEESRKANEWRKNNLEKNAFSSARYRARHLNYDKRERSQKGKKVSMVSRILAQVREGVIPVKNKTLKKHIKILQEELKK